jgi:hypothetical protein
MNIEMVIGGERKLMDRTLIHSDIKIAKRRNYTVYHLVQGGKTLDVCTRIDDVKQNLRRSAALRVRELKNGRLYDTTEYHRSTL